MIYMQEAGAEVAAADIYQRAVLPGAVRLDPEGLIREVPQGP